MHSSIASHHVAVPADDRAAIEDVLLRFGAGQDLSDRELFESAFAQDAILDFTGPASRLGVEIDVFRGRQSIADNVLSTTSRLDTTHTVTNQRITKYDGETAQIFALVEAQHLPRDDHGRHLMLKNIYWTDVVKSDGCWLAASMTISCVWLDGEASVLFEG